MRIKILMACADNTDAEMLKEHGFLVYTCDEYTLKEMVDEIKPALVFINKPGNEANDIYNKFLNDLRFLSYPVIYTLAEDDVYIVNRKRTAAKKKRTVISDNIIDGIKTALLDFDTVTTPDMRPHSKNIPVSYYAHRA